MDTWTRATTLVHVPTPSYQVVPVCLAIDSEVIPGEDSTPYEQAVPLGEQCGIAIPDFASERIECIVEFESLVADLVVGGQEPRGLQVAGDNDPVWFLECVLIDQVPQFCGKGKEW